MAGVVYYTKEEPGRWAKKVAGHLPNLKVRTEAGKQMLEITTAHEMKAHEHYIVKHLLLDSSFGVVGEKMFDPTQDKAALSLFDVSGRTGKFYALSMCNKHDTWLATIEV
jgi:superoxide reductase